MMDRAVIGVGLLLALASLGCDRGGEAPRKEEGSVFASLQAEIFTPKCSHTGCHGGEHPAGELDLSADAAYRELVDVAAHRRPERKLVVPGDPGASYLMGRLAPGGDTPLMPLAGKPLPDVDLERLRNWIREGAKR